MASTPGNNFEMGNMMTTGRELDVALAGPGWFALQTPQGEAYTRAGALQVGVNGLLQTATGQPVLSDQNAVIEVPDQASLTIASDGTVTAIGAGDPPNNILNLGRLKMVNPPPQQLVHGDDGVFRMPPQPGGQPARAAAGRSVAAPIERRAGGQQRQPHGRHGGHDPERAAVRDADAGDTRGGQERRARQRDSGRGQLIINARAEAPRQEFSS